MAMFFCTLGCRECILGTVNAKSGPMMHVKLRYRNGTNLKRCLVNELYVKSTVYRFDRLKENLLVTVLP